MGSIGRTAGISSAAESCLVPEAAGAASLGAGASARTAKSVAGVAVLSLGAEDERGPAGESDFPSRRFTSSAKSSSRELEWVFLSTIPSSGRRSMTALFGTSSSRASSLIRIMRSLVRNSSVITTLDELRVKTSL
jgi:hypothetical protein